MVLEPEFLNSAIKKLPIVSTWGMNLLEYNIQWKEVCRIYMGDEFVEIQHPVERGVCAGCCVLCVACFRGQDWIALVAESSVGSNALHAGTVNICAMQSACRKSHNDQTIQRSE